MDPPETRGNRSSDIREDHRVLPSVSPHVSSFSYVVVTMARWEHAFLFEWIIYHLLIGFHHIYVYDNGERPEEPLQDAVLPFLEKIGRDTRVTFLPFPGYRVQPLVYCHWMQHYRDLYPRGYAAFIDVDEYIVFPKDDTIESFMHRVMGPGERSPPLRHIAMPWIMFGTSNVWKLKGNTPLIEQLTRRGRYPGHQIKSLVCLHHLPPKETFQIVSIHNITGVDTRLSNGYPIHGDSIPFSCPSPSAHFPLNVDVPVFDLDVYLHHYFSRDEYRFLVKTFSKRTCGCSPKERRYSMYSEMFRYRNGYNRVVDNRLSQRFSSKISQLMQQAGYSSSPKNDTVVIPSSIQLPPSPTPRRHHHALWMVHITEYVLRHFDLRRWWRPLFVTKTREHLRHYKDSQEKQQFINLMFLQYHNDMNDIMKQYHRTLKRCPYL